MTEDPQQQQQLSALLRLKRFEQPPQGYYEKLLQDVHRRQRADLLHRPAWKLLVERVQTFFSQHSFGYGYGSYAGAAAAVVLVACGIFIAATPHKPATATATASAITPTTAPAIAAIAEPVNLRSDRPLHAVLSLEESPLTVASAVDSNVIMANERLIPTAFSQGSIRPARKPRYVIDTVPVSYEATQVSFNF